MDRRWVRGAWLAGVAAGFALSGIGVVPAEASPAAVTGFGSAVSHGAPSALNAPISGIAVSHDGKGYWLVGADGGVFAYGDAHFEGSASTEDYGIPITGIAPSPDGGGYWLSNYGGTVWNFGDAHNVGDLPDSLVFPTAPIVAIASDPKADGYWLAGADGGVFSFGAARFHGSLGGVHLRAPIVGVAAMPDGAGYWLVGSDGGVFSFGAARFHGSLGGVHLRAPIVGVAAMPDGAGYWLVGSDGGVFSFGDARFEGSEGSDPPSSSVPVVAIASSPAGQGYWLATSDRALPPAGSAPTVLAACDQFRGPAVIEPTDIVLACGDGNASLTSMHWSSWTAEGAVGSGDYTHNLCQPDCADGTFVSDPAQVRLSYPIESGAGPQFSAITFSFGGRVVSALLEATPVG